jgi:polyribonucleotide 5'-hydroxyl-kinase
VAPSSALPLGMEQKAEELQILKVEGSALIHSILFLSNSDLSYNATEEDETTLPFSNLAGLVYVSEVDDKKNRLHLLCPNAGRLPKRYLWMGTLRWAEI